MPDFVAKPPDFNLSAISKATQVKGTIGVGWTQPDGTIRIKLNSFVVLNSADDLVITLFPKQSDGGTIFPKPSHKKQPNKKFEPLLDTDSYTPDLDIPF